MILILVVLRTNPSGLYRHGGGQGYTESVTMVGDLHIRIAKLAFHAKESPIRTRDEVFNLVSSQSWSPADDDSPAIQTPPPVQDSLSSP